MICKLSSLGAPPAGTCPPRKACAEHRCRAGAALLAVALAGGLAGCGSVSDAANSAGLPVQDWSDVRTKREPKPALVELRHSIVFSGTSQGIDRGEADRLRAFVAAADLRYGDRVLVVANVPDSAATGDAGRLAGRRADAAAAFLGRERVNAVVAQASGSPNGIDGEVTVLIRRYVAVLPACPDWSDVPGVNFNNQPTSNWSCATAMNFGMMLADPGDLVRGRDPGYADGEYSALGVEKYRKGRSKDLIRDSSAGEVYPSTGNSSGGQ